MFIVTVFLTRSQGAETLFLFVEIVIVVVIPLSLSLFMYILDIFKTMDNTTFYQLAVFW